MRQIKNAVVLLLLQTIEELMSKKGISDITVSEILRISGVSRSTFYRYFLDKYDLCNQVLGSFIEGLVHAEAHLDYRSFLYSLLLHIREEKKFYLNAFSHIGQNSFFRYFDENMCEQLSLRLFGSHMCDLPKDKAYFIKYHCGALFRILLSWINSGCKEDPQEICDILITTMCNRNEHYFDRLFIDSAE